MEKKTNQAKITNLHGTTMMAVDKIGVKEDAIVMTGNIMGSMPGSFYVTPEDMWKMVRMANWSLVRSIPGMLFKGWYTYRKNIKSSQTKR